MNNNSVIFKHFQDSSLKGYSIEKEYQTLFGRDLSEIKVNEKYNIHNEDAAMQLYVSSGIDWDGDVMQLSDGNMVFIDIRSSIVSLLSREEVRVLTYEA